MPNTILNILLFPRDTGQTFCAVKLFLDTYSLVESKYHLVPFFFQRACPNQCEHHSIAKIVFTFVLFKVVFIFTLITFAIKIITFQAEVKNSSPPTTVSQLSVICQPTVGNLLVSCR